MEDYKDIGIFALIMKAAAYDAVVYSMEFPN
jgi:hypothetical protein